MKVQTRSALLWLLVPIYLISCVLVISESSAVRALLYLFQGLFLIMCLRQAFHIRNNVVLLFFLGFAVNFCIGLMQGNHPSFFVRDVMAFSVLAALFVMSIDNRDWFSERIVCQLSPLVLIGGVVAVYFFSTNGLQPAASVGDRLLMDNVEEGGHFKAAMAVTQISLLLLPFFWCLPVKSRVVVGGVTFIFFLVNAFILSRAAVAAALLSCFFTLCIGVSSGGLKPRFTTVVVVFSAVVGLILGVVYYWEVIGSLYDLILIRFLELSSDAVEPRDVEAQAYFSSASIYEVFFGKGFGGVNNFPFGGFSERGVMMLHRGENNLILKGGIPLLILLYGAAFISLCRLLFLSAGKYRLPWASVIVLFLFLERGHQQYSQFFMLLLFSLAISYGLASDVRSASASFQKSAK